MNSICDSDALHYSHLILIYRIFTFSDTFPLCFSLAREQTIFASGIIQPHYKVPHRSTYPVMLQITHHHIISLSLNNMETDSYSTALSLYFTLGQALSPTKDFYMMNSHLLPATVDARGPHGT